MNQSVQDSTLEHVVQENALDQDQDTDLPIQLLSKDRRLTIRLMGLWRGSRLGSEPYVRADVFMKTVDDELRRDCCIIEIAENGECKLYEIGENIGRHSNVDSANAKADDLPPRSLLAIAVRQLKDACAFEAPIIDEGETWNEKGEPVPFRSILLPLCDDYGQAVKFLAGGRCKNIPSDV